MFEMLCAINFDFYLFIVRSYATSGMNFFLYFFLFCLEGV